MQKIGTREATHGFSLKAHTSRSEAATMVLAPGESTGGPKNEHERSDQWLFVTAGRGEVIVDGNPVTVEAGDLLLIEAGEKHEVRSVGDAPLTTWNVYAPPEYSDDGS